MIPCAGICVILTFVFIKRVSLRREDDAQRKAEGKAWVEAQKAKRNAKKHHGEQSEDDDHHGALRSLEDGLEEAGRGEEEAAGVIPSKDEGELDAGRR